MSKPPAMHSPAPLCEGLSGDAKIRKVAVWIGTCAHIWEDTADEDRPSRQYRRPTPYGKAAAAEDRLRFHRRRARGRTWPRNQHLCVSQAQIAAAVPRRCVKARPDKDDLRPDLCEPVRHLADRRGGAVPL